MELSLKLNLEHEFKSVFRKLLSIAGEERCLTWLKHYEETFGREDWETYERLRAFPLYLRNENRLKRVDEPWLVDLALWEWTEFVTLYSPVSEESERKSLSPSEYLFNPSAQILRLDWNLVGWSGSGKPQEEKTMAFVYREFGNSSWKLRSRIADWSSAAIVDVLLEQGRISESDLIREIEQTQGSGHTQSWLEKVNELCVAGVILRRL